MLIPFGFLGHIEEISFARVLWIIKTTRIRYLFKIFRVSFYSPVIRGYWQRKVDTLIIDPELKDDVISDNIKIHRQLYIFYYIKLIYLSILIILVAYMMGMSWYIYVDFQKDHLSNKNHEQHVIEGNNFYDVPWKQFNGKSLNEMEPARITLISIYYSLTTISVVGFGDFYPINSQERLVCVLFFMCGIISLSFIQG